MKKLFLIAILTATAAFAQEPVNVPAEMAIAANSFLASLDGDLAKKAKFPFAADQRENAKAWHWRNSMRSKPPSCAPS